MDSGEINFLCFLYEKTTILAARLVCKNCPQGARREPANSPQGFFGGLQNSPQTARKQLSANYNVARRDKKRQFLQLKKTTIF